MQPGTGCGYLLSDTAYKALCDSNPGSEHNILFHPTITAGQEEPLPALRAKKASFRRVDTEGAGDRFVISLLNGREGTEVRTSSVESSCHIVPRNYLYIFSLFFWCPCMAINVSVQYNGGLLPDIILLTQSYYHRGTRLNAMKRFCICSF